MRSRCAFGFNSLIWVCVNKDPQTLAFTALSLGVATDIFTAAALSYFLHKMRTGYKR
jgi:hypothetical protein